MSKLKELTVPSIASPLFCAAIFCLFPILSAPLVFLFYLYNSRFRTFYSLLLGLFFGIIAYHLVPPESFDLYRHHEAIATAIPLNHPSFFELLLDSAEPAMEFFNSLTAMTGNPNLLQLLVVSLGYWILFYIIGDYARKIKLKPLDLFLTTLFILSAFTCISFFSGLWNYLAMLVFALGFYWDISLQKKKIGSYALYAIAVLLHTSMIFPLAILIIFKLTKKRLTLTSIILTLSFIVMPTLLFNIISQLSSIPIFFQLNAMYESYLIGEKATLEAEYNSRIVIMELSKLLPFAIILLLYRTQKKELDHIITYGALLSLAVLVIIPSSILLIRYILLVLFVCFPLIMHFLQEAKSTSKSLLIITALLLSAFYINYQIMMFSKATYGPLFPEHAIVSIFEIFKQG